MDKIDKKSILSRIPETIREMLSKNLDIMNKGIMLDDLFDNILSAVKEIEQEFVITAFHDKMRY